jgi:hypothetical protein
VGTVSVVYISPCEEASDMGEKALVGGPEQEPCSHLGCALPHEDPGVRLVAGSSSQASGSSSELGTVALPYPGHQVG